MFEENGVRSLGIYVLFTQEIIARLTAKKAQSRRLGIKAFMVHAKVVKEYKTYLNTVLAMPHCLLNVCIDASTIVLCE